MMQVGFYFDQTRCTGCNACQVTCKDANDIPAGPENWLRLGYVEEGRTPDLMVAYLFSPCWQCEKPVCADACPVDAISKRAENGIVEVDQEVCLGKEPCGAKCQKACPYGAPQFGPKADAKMAKCDFCLKANGEGALAPACVEACPTRALDAGSMTDLRAKYGEATAASGFKYSERTKPAAIFKSKPRKA
jgi:anaerobic dimethyl sulfoxide reductase subunit B (iron-sulfur subunit)